MTIVLLVPSKSFVMTDKNLKNKNKKNNNSYMVYFYVFDLISHTYYEYNWAPLSELA